MQRGHTGEGSLEDLRVKGGQAGGVGDVRQKPLERLDRPVLLQNLRERCGQQLRAHAHDCFVSGSAAAGTCTHAFQRPD